MTRDCLAEAYDSVDLFDRDARAIEVAQRNTFDLANVVHVDCSTMEEFELQDEYDGIFLRWCIGYLED